MIRGDVYLAVLDPSQGSEQAGTRPVIVVSRDAINKLSPVVVIVPLTSRANKNRILRGDQAG
jgi:mRNA interferase MazF